MITIQAATILALCIVTEVFLMKKTRKSYHGIFSHFSIFDIFGNFGIFSYCGIFGIFSRIKGIGTLCNGKGSTSLQACKSPCILWIVAKYSRIVDINAEDIKGSETAEDIKVIKDIENAEIFSISQILDMYANKKPEV